MRGFDRARETFLDDINEPEEKPIEHEGAPDEVVKEAPEREVSEPKEIPTPDPSSWTQPVVERLDRLNEQMRQNTQRREERQQPQQQQYARTRQVYDDELYGLADYTTKQLQQTQAELEAMKAREHQRAQADMYREDRLHRQAVENLSRKFPNFNEVVPPQLRANALAIAKNKVELGRDWEDEMEKYYWSVEGPRRYAEEKKSDEVGKKREVKEQTRSQAAQVPRAGGASYQRPEAQREPGKGDKGYKVARNGFLSELKQRFGG